MIWLFPFSSSSISLPLSRIYFKQKGYLCLCFHLCSSLKSTEQTTSYVPTRVSLEILKTTTGFPTREAAYTALRRTPSPICALLLNSSFQNRRESSLDPNTSKKRWICTSGSSDCCQRRGLSAPTAGREQWRAPQLVRPRINPHTLRTVWQEPGIKSQLVRVFPLTSQEQVFLSCCEAQARSDANRKAPIFY